MHGGFAWGRLWMEDRVGSRLFRLSLPACLYKKLGRLIEMKSARLSSDAWLVFQNVPLFGALFGAHAPQSGSEVALKNQLLRLFFFFFIITLLASFILFAFIPF